MLNHLRDLLLSDRVFTVSISLREGDSSRLHYSQVGVIDVDDVGIVVRDEGKLRAVPWTAIAYMNIED